MRAISFAIGLVSLLLSACVTPGDSRPVSQPAPVRSEYFQSEGGGFMTNIGKPQVSAGISVKVIKPIPPRAKLTASFENPSNPAMPFVSAVDYEGKTTLFIASPEFEGVKNREKYKIVLSITDANDKPISEHVQYIMFNMPDQMAHMMGITLIKPE